MPDPTGDEIAAEERALVALGSVQPLAPHTVEGLVARALAEPVAATRQPLAPVHPHRIRHWLVAALLVGSFVSVAFVGARIVWPERRLAPLTMDYVEAIDVATNPAYDEAGHLHALGRIDEECAFATQCLRRLVADPDANLATMARRILEAAATQIADRVTSSHSPIHGSLVECVSIAQDVKRTPADRAAALERMAERLRAGLTAILVARQAVLEEDESLAKVEAWLGRIARELRP